MGSLRFVKPERISLARHTELREQWVQDRIAEDPSILGLGDLILRDKQRVQPNAGRLDLPLQHPDLNQRYEVEIQLGATNEGHIIRTIEYWDIERRRYPQYDHCAVIVAEDITSRFLNVIGLFNSQIPLIAIQMRALKFDEIISLVFTIVMNRFEPGLPEDEESQSMVNRDYWESQVGTPATVAMADKLLAAIGSFAPGFQLNYTKSYIGLSKDGRSQNFALFRPRKGFLMLSFWLERSDEVDQRLESAGLDVMPYDERWARYRLRLTDADLKKHADLLKDLLRQSYESTQNA
jgi:hypothetical protein